MKLQVLIIIPFIYCQLLGQSKVKNFPTQENEDQLDTYVNEYFSKRASFMDKFSKDISIDEQKELDKIVDNIKSSSPKSSDYFYIEYINQGSSIAAFPLLEKARDLYPNNVELYDDFIYHYELTNETILRSNYSKKLYESNTIHEGLMEYNYNVLMSLDKDAILITNGSEDKFPIFIWHDVFKIRTDVTIINIDMLSELTYINNKKLHNKLNIKQQNSTIKTAQFLIENNPNKQIYLGHTINQKLLEKYKSKLYLSGLTYLYSNKQIDNVKSAVSKFENEFKTEQLARPCTNSKINSLNFNYILPLVTFLEYYKGQNNMVEYRKTKDLILIISKRVGKDQFISDYLNSLNL